MVVLNCYLNYVIKASICLGLFTYSPFSLKWQPFFVNNNKCFNNWLFLYYSIFFLYTTYILILLTCLISRLTLVKFCQFPKKKVILVVIKSKILVIWGESIFLNIGILIQKQYLNFGLQFWWEVIRCSPNDLHFQVFHSFVISSPMTCF